jgi:hypothetical protein
MAPTFDWKFRIPREDNPNNYSTSLLCTVRQIVLGLKRPVIQKMLEFNAPSSILWEEMKVFHPEMAPVSSKPQLALLKQWADARVVAVTRQGAKAPVYTIVTDRGTIQFAPRGRFGPHLKVV